MQEKKRSPPSGGSRGLWEPPWSLRRQHHRRPPSSRVRTRAPRAAAPLVPGWSPIVLPFPRINRTGEKPAARQACRYSATTLRTACGRNAYPYIDHVLKRHHDRFRKGSYGVVTRVSGFHRNTGLLHGGVSSALCGLFSSTRLAIWIDHRTSSSLKKSAPFFLGDKRAETRS